MKALRGAEAASHEDEEGDGSWILPLQKVRTSIRMHIRTYICASMRSYVVKHFFRDARTSHDEVVVQLNDYRLLYDSHTCVTLLKR